MTKTKCRHPRWTDWSFVGHKWVMQVRSCWDCDKTQTRKDPAQRKTVNIKSSDSSKGAK